MNSQQNEITIQKKYNAQATPVYLHDASHPKGPCWSEAFATLAETRLGQVKCKKRGFNMLYRTMNKSGQKLSILGYGCMRLPGMMDGNIRRDEAISEIRYAIDHGVNYLDTAYAYGDSEVVLGEALKDGYRKRVSIATKLPSFLVESREQMDEILNEQLKRLQTDHIDYYLIHSLSSDRWLKMEELGIKDFLDKAIADGKIKYTGFSFHDVPKSFQAIVDGYDWTLCQIQYNYLDEEYQAGTNGLKYAASKGLGIIIMEPLRGGLLTKHIPDVDKVWDKAEHKRSPAEWGLQWVWDHPEVTVVLSGMSTMEQVIDNLKYAENGLPNTLTPKELLLVEKVKEVYKTRVKVPCTSCGYCMPCPKGIQIPECFTSMNNANIFDTLKYEKGRYNGMLKIGMTTRASECAECGQCEEKCPQHITVTGKLKEFSELFEA